MCVPVSLPSQKPTHNTAKQEPVLQVRLVEAVRNALRLLLRRLLLLLLRQQGAAADRPGG